MKQYSATLWSNMNMSFPSEVAKKLGIWPGDKIVFVDRGDQITIEKEGGVCGQKA